MTHRWPALTLVLSAVLLILGAVLTQPYGNFFQADVLPHFWVGTAVMGAGFVLAWWLRSVPIIWFWGVAIATRLILLPMTPGDDVWRYLWEGHIQNLGFSPYHFAPDAAELIPHRLVWWPLINHSDVSAIYPPITQLGFRGLAAIAPNLYLFKIAFVLTDLVVSWLLSHRFGTLKATLYAWNPMVIYSFAGGAHYDSWFILPLVAAWFLIDAAEASEADRIDTSPVHPWGGALLIGVSAAVKWISLPLLGWLVWRSRQRWHGISEIGLGIVGLLPLLLSALPYCRLESCPLIPTDSTFVAYGRSAEFIPHWLAQVWPASQQANWIYGIPLLLWVGWLIIRAPTFQQCAEGYWFGLLLLTPIVHFWYFTWLVPFSIPTQNWGVRLISLSGFIYFVLPSRLPDWRLTSTERLWLWLPFILGWLWTCQQSHPTNPHHQLKQPSSD